MAKKKKARPAKKAAAKKRPAAKKSAKKAPKARRRTTKRAAAPAVPWNDVTSRAQAAIAALDAGDTAGARSNLEAIQNMAPK